MVRLLLLFSFMTFSFVGSSAAVWQRKIENYDKAKYQAGHQNWQVRQSENKWMYFANSLGLLEFDGTTWNLFPIKNKLLRSVLVSEKRIYAGGSSEFGYYEPNEIGLLKYHSLSDKIPRWGGEVWNIYRDRQTIYFVSDGNIHIYNEQTNQTKSLDVYSYFQSIDCSALVNNTLYLGTINGVYKLDQKGMLEFLPHTKILAGKKIVALLLDADKKMVALTSYSGIYEIDDSVCTPFRLNAEAESFIQQNQLFCGAISKNKMVLGTVQNGAILTEIRNPEAKVEKFDLSTGLNNNTILSAYFDSKDNLWLGADRGISFIDLQSPIRPLFAKTSPIGTGYCSIMYHNKLYLGTNQGLYCEEGERLTPMPHANGQIWSMQEFDDMLFVCGDNGITVISPNDSYKVNIKGCWDIKKTKDPNKLIIALYSGFGILVRNGGRWVFSHPVPEFFYSTRGFLVDRREDNTFWTTDINRHKVYKVSFDDYFSRVVHLKEYRLKNTTFEDNPYIREIENSIVICTKNGVYRYSLIDDSFVEYPELNKMLEGDSYYDYLNMDKQNNLWYISNGIINFIEFKNGTYSKTRNIWALNTELTKGYENIYNIDSQYAIVSIDNGFYQIDRSRQEAKDEALSLSIRKFWTMANDSIIDYNNSRLNIELPYAQNSVRFSYTATDYSNSQHVIYAFKLDGFDENWSSPTSATTKEYTNLPEGEYTFMVKAYKKENPEKTTISQIKFKIAPPWYRSIWAYILYSLAFIFTSYIITKRLIEYKQKKIIQERNEILAQKIYFEAENKQKDKEILKLQNETLQKDLEYKTQELTGYILNLTQKNEMLESVKRNALSVSKALDEKQSNSTIKQKIVRMIGQINSNIEHDKDFKVFESNFDFVHQGFFKKLDEKHPNLTRNEKILFAYLKMNLTSKEIAPLMNISIRGVEVSRYRLRKKLGLDRDVNLSEYTAKFQE